MWPSRPSLLCLRSRPARSGGFVLFPRITVSTCMPKLDHWSPLFLCLAPSLCLCLASLSVCDIRLARPAIQAHLFLGLWFLCAEWGLYSCICNTVLCTHSYLRNHRLQSICIHEAILLLTYVPILLVVFPSVVEWLGIGHNSLHVVYTHSQVTIRLQCSDDRNS